MAPRPATGWVTAGLCPAAGCHTPLAFGVEGDYCTDPACGWGAARLPRIPLTIRPICRCNLRDRNEQACEKCKLRPKDWPAVDGPTGQDPEKEREL